MGDLKSLVASRGPISYELDPGPIAEISTLAPGTTSPDSISDTLTLKCMLPTPGSGGIVPRETS